MDQPSNSPVTSKQGAEDDRPKRARKTKRIVEQVELSKELKHCQRVVVSLLSHRYASPFAAPVDAVRLNIPDYYTVIKNPMDFGTIKEKLTSGSYESVDQFNKDVELVFTNCETYNPPDSEIVAVYVKTLREVYTSGMAPLFASMKAEAAAAAAAAAAPAAPVPAVQSASAEIEETERKRVKKRKTEHKQSAPSTPVASTGAVPYNEKVRLARAISSLKESNLGPVIDILLRYREIDPETSVVKDEVVVDLDSVSNDALRELSTYVYSLVSRPEI